MPIRTSIITGKKDEQKNFWRFTCQDGVLVQDGKTPNPGRGIYTEKDPELCKKLPKLRGKIAYKLGVKKIAVK